MNHPHVRKYMAHQVVPVPARELDSPEVLAKRRQDFHDIKLTACFLGVVVGFAAGIALVMGFVIWLTGACSTTN